MICEPCRNAGDISMETLGGTELKKLFHSECKGGTWCDCQHRVEPKKIV